MGFSPINNYNYGTNLQSGSSSKNFNDGTAELLRNVLGGPKPYDYENQDGDTLTLSASSKQQLTQGDFLAMAQRVQAVLNDQSTESIPPAVKEFYAKYAVGSGKGVLVGIADEAPDAVKKFFKEISPSDLRNMSLDQIPDDVKNFVKANLPSPLGQTGMSSSYQNMDSMKSANPDDTARKLVNSLFVNANSLDVNNSGSHQNSSVRDEDLLKMVTDSLKQVFNGLNLNSQKLPSAVKDDLNTVYSLAKQRINQWAAVNSVKSATDS